MKGIFAIVLIATIGFTTIGAAPTTTMFGSHKTVTLEVPAQTLIGLPDILGPQLVEIGELARLEVAGDRVAWDCVPTINDGQSFGENNQKFVCSFRKRGLYTIVAAVYRDDDVLVMKFPIQVGAITLDDPDEPEDPVDPVKPVISTDLTLVKAVVEWCKSTSSNKSQCQLVASVFEVVTKEIENDKLSTTGEIIERTAELNQDVEIDGLGSLMGKLQAWLTQEADAGRLETVKQHLVAWKSIAQGLAEYASS